MMRLGLGGGEIPAVNGVQTSHEVVVDVGNVSSSVDLGPFRAVQQEEKPNAEQEFMISKFVLRTV